MARDQEIRYFDENDVEQVAPHKWEICPACEGAGSTCRHVGVIDGEDQDFVDDVRAGHYDRACEACNGRGSVIVPDYSKMTKAQRAAVRAMLDEERGNRRAAEAEFRFCYGPNA